jgi:hypothetical protein
MQQHAVQHGDGSGEIGDLQRCPEVGRVVLGVAESLDRAGQRGQELQGRQQELADLGLTLDRVLGSIKKRVKLF